jgi:hypothetical protein
MKVDSGIKDDKDLKNGKDGGGDTKDDQQRNRDKDERRVRKIMDGESGTKGDKDRKRGKDDVDGTKGDEDRKEDKDERRVI